MFCSKCGTQSEDGNNFCQQCGNPMQSGQGYTNQVYPRAKNKGRSLLGYYAKCWVNYFNFEGRARRREFWGFFLFYFIFGFASAIIDVIIFGEEVPLACLTNLYCIVSVIPWLSVSVRRLHDTDRSGWWILLPIIPLIFCCQDSQPEENMYGLNPKNSDD